MLKKSDINLKEWEFEFQQRNNQPFLMCDMYCRSLYNNHRKEINLPIERLDYLFTSSGRGYVKSAQKVKIIKGLKLAPDNHCGYILKGTMKRIKELDSFANDIKINAKISNKEIISLWKEFDKIFLTVIPWFYIPWYLTEENIVSDRIKKKLLKYKKEIEKITNLDNALMTLIFPIKEAMFQKEQKDFFNLVKIAEDNSDYQNNKPFIKKAEKYLERYSWITTYLILPLEPLNMEDLITKIKNAIKNNFTETYKKQQLKKVENKKIADKIIKIFKNDKELLDDIESAQELGWLLNFSIESALTATSKLIPLFKTIAERIKIPYKQWVCLTSEEIVRSLEDKLVITKKEIKERQIGCVFMSEKGKKRVLIGKEGKKLGEWIDDNIGAVDQKVSEIRGQTASPGLVKGSVKIILYAKDSSLLKKGEVLVCSMTSPNYISAMKKSSAIITDEGGLLSHAAIVSRELGKPCIVGTKIATKVLKDGNLVEVDAEKGIVRILKRTK